jgi:hypothetical protein
MALLGGGDGTRRLAVPTMNLLRGAAGFTMGAWCYFTSESGGVYRSLVRMDGTFSLLQITNANFMQTDYWNPVLALGFSAAAMVNGTLPLNTWAFVGVVYCAGAGTLTRFEYAPGRGVLWESGSFAISNPTFQAGAQSLWIGATETQDEAMRAGWGVAEIMLLRGELRAAAIPTLAHSPQAFANRLRFYLPLRTAKSHSELVGGRSYPLSYDTNGRSAIVPTFHPPVERWRTASSVITPLAHYSGASMVVRAHK